MKTRELIEALQKEDPSGEFEVCVGNIPIYFIEALPAYYDGHLQMLVQDDAKKPYYNIVGYKITGQGHKVKIHTMDLEDCLVDNPDLPVDISELSPSNRERWKYTIAEHRRLAFEVEELNVPRGPDIKLERT